MAALIPNSTIDDITRKADIIDIVGSHVDLSRKGNRWWGLCPFHTEKTPSFSVSQETNLYYCFGCHRGGGVFQFLMEMDGLTFVEAVRRLAEKTGVEIPQSGGRTEDRDAKRALERLYTLLSQTFHKLLLDHPGAQGARSYLTKRGITEQSIALYRLGWSPSDGEWLHRFLISKKYSPEFLAASGLFSRRTPRWSLFSDRLMFPVMPDKERVIAFSGRALSDNGPKYINSPETSIYRKRQSLYGLGQALDGIRKTRTSVLCEGNLDVVSCVQAGIAEAVAPLGTAVTEDQLRHLKRRSDTVILMFDGDPAGLQATMKTAVIAENAGFKVKAAKLPENSDPADVLHSQGAETLKKMVEKSMNVFDYLIESVVSAKTNRSGEAQEEALQELTPYLDVVTSEVRREAYIRQLAGAIKADPMTVMREYRQKGRRRSENRREPKKELQPEVENDELYLMTAVAVRTEYFPFLRSMLAPEMLRDRRALSVYRVMDELNVSDLPQRTDLIVSKLDDEGLAHYIIKTAAAGVYSEGAEETIREKIQIIKKRALTDERNELLLGLSQQEEAESGKIEAYIKRIQWIDREILGIGQGDDGGNKV